MITLPGSTLTVSPLCYGTGSWGSEVHGEELERLYSTFRAAGGNAFDTAHCYAFWLDAEGASERALGDCVHKFERRREDVVVVTKGGHPFVPPKYSKPDAFLSPEVLRKELRESLDRLRMDYVDLYLLHRDDARVPVAETIDALAEHVTAGRIRHIGASNWSTARMAAANAYAASRGRPPFVASQVQWSLAAPSIPYGNTDPTPRSLSEQDLFWHVQTQMPIFAYTPTAGGFFASGGARDSGFNNPVARERLARVDELTRVLGATRNQIALAYLMSWGFACVPILGTSDLNHLSDALGAPHVKLTRKLASWLRDGGIR